MNKKIIALSLALVIMITCFTACKQKRETTKINGNEVILVTDENGNPIINEKNEVVAVVTDRDGEVITYENGEDQTYYIQLNDALVIDGVANGKNYRMNVLKGWTVGRSDRINKDGTEDDCYIQFVKIKDVEKDYTIETYLEELDAQNEKLIAAFEAKGFTVTIDEGKDTVSTKYISCDTRAYKVVDGSGKVVHYAENYYFTAGKTIYAINYACENGVGYDESFDFGEYLKTNFTYVD